MEKEEYEIWEPLCRVLTSLQPLVSCSGPFPLQCSGWFGSDSSATISLNTCWLGWRSMTPALIPPQNMVRRCQKMSEDTAIFLQLRSACEFRDLSRLEDLWFIDDFPSYTVNLHLVRGFPRLPCFQRVHARKHIAKAKQPVPHGCSISSGGLFLGPKTNGCHRAP